MAFPLRAVAFENSHIMGVYSKASSPLSYLRILAHQKFAWERSRARFFDLRDGQTCPIGGGVGAREKFGRLRHARLVRKDTPFSEIAPVQFPVRDVRAERRKPHKTR